MITVLAATSAPALADYAPYSATPPLTGIAAAPMDIPITHSNMIPTKNPDGTYTPAQADTFTFAITGKDMDTYVNPQGGATTEFADTSLSCQKESEDYPTISGPTLRGFAGDGTATWDIVGRGVLVAKGTPTGVSPAKVYVNAYRLFDNPQNALAPVLIDSPGFARQTLIQPAF